MGFFDRLTKKILDSTLDKDDRKHEQTAKAKKSSADEDHRSEAAKALDGALDMLDRPALVEKRLMNASERRQKINEAKAAAQKVMTPERQELIQNALKIQRTKAKILEDLDDEDRAKLYLTAIRAFMGPQGKN